MEASALPASVGLARARLGIGVPLLRLRSDEQLVSLFRAGNEDAFRVIHDRYRSRMLAYTRQMLAAAPAEAEDAVQEIFVRAYGGLRSNRRDLALRAWLYRIAHNRCIDELRRPRALAVETVEQLGEAGGSDLQARVEQREALRRLISDIRRLPEQQRSALLMRELGGMPYADLAGALGVSVPAVKSLLVRARVGLAQASDARDTPCTAIREDLILAHDRGVRASGLARRHLRDCAHCRQFRTEVHGVSRQLGLLVPALGPLGVIAKLIGFGGLGIGGGSSAAAGSGAGAAAGTGAVAGTSAAAGTGAVVGTSAAAGTGAIAGTGALAGGGAVAGGSALAAAGAGHVVTIIAATVVAAGGAIGIKSEVASPGSHHAHRHHVTRVAADPVAAPQPAVTAPQTGDVAAAPVRTATPSAPSTQAAARRLATAGIRAENTEAQRLSKLRDPDDAGYPVRGTTTDPTVTTPGATTAPGTTTPVSTDPTSTAPGTTTEPATWNDPTSTTPGTTVPGTTTAPGAVTTTPVTTTAPTPITGSPTTTTPVTTTPTTASGGATGIAPTVTPASTGTGSGGASEKVRAKTKLIVKRAGAADSSTVQ